MSADQVRCRTTYQSGGYMNGFLTVEDVGRRLSLSPRRVCELLRAGTLKGTKIGQQWRIARADLDASVRASITLFARGRPPPREAVAETADLIGSPSPSTTTSREEK